MRTDNGRGVVRKKIGAYGTWPSPITPETVGGQSLRLGLVQSLGPWLYWTEGRPAEGGRVTIMRARSSGRPDELLPPGYSARSRIHEYGGGEFLVAAGADGDRVFFVNDKDQQIHEFTVSTKPSATAKVVPITSDPTIRFADFALDVHRNRLIAVAERHPSAVDGPPSNLLVAISLADRDRGALTELAQGQDFYAFPRPSPDGRCLAFIAWSLPDMPWDQAILSVAEFQDDGRLAKSRRIAGGVAAIGSTASGAGAAAKASSVSEPVWSPAGVLLFVSDRSGFDNIYAWEPGKRVRALVSRDADFGRPLWSLGTKSYALAANGQIGMAFLERGEARMGVLDPASGAFQVLDLPLRQIDQVVAHGDAFAGLASRDNAPPALVDIPLKGAPRVIRATSPFSLIKGTVARGRVIEIAVAGDPVYAVYYAPTNANWSAPKDTKPPALVLAHGGPTGAADRGLKLKIQFWTSRGFAVLDVDYSGSTGYGRAYRRRLEGQWGVRDVADVIAAADHLEARGLADAGKIVISGGSAGGYTVLMALCGSRRFAAGICYYGICDLRLLAAHTHKFESGYLNRLLGLDDASPETTEQILDERSPLELADSIATPLILFHGREDKVVPPAQSRLIVERLIANNVAAEFWEFDAEGHGFRRSGTIATAIDRELAFVTKVLRLRPLD